MSQVNLHSLKLNHNIISDISSQALAGLSVLSSLHFGFNRLESLEANLFNNCSSLVDLYLQGNMLRQVPEAVRQIKLLKTLDLGDNMLTNSLTADSLTGLHHLYGLRLAGNGLRTLNASMFKSVAKLQVLNLADNQLSKLDEVRNMFFVLYDIHTHMSYLCEPLSTTLSVFEFMNRLWCVIATFYTFSFSFYSSFTLQSCKFISIHQLKYLSHKINAF